jgi:transcription antitermination protein NusB
MPKPAGKIPLSHRKRARDLLVQAIYQWQMSGYPPEQIEAEYRADNGKKVDWEFFNQAITTIAAEAEKLDAVYHPLLDRELHHLDPIETAILRLGIFELSKRIDVPYKVVINEYVDLAKKYGAAESHKYINGVLDKSARDLRKVEMRLPA